MSEEELLEQKKNAHIEKARQLLKGYSDKRDTIQSKELREHLDGLFDALRELKDTEYLFESGERQLDDLYDRYLPYAMRILDEYLRISSVQGYAQVKNVRDKLYHTLDLTQSAIHEISSILPQDEISEASAEAKARNTKKKLDELTMK
jgi:hypothetical protein